GATRPKQHLSGVAVEDEGQPGGRAGARRVRPAALPGTAQGLAHRNGGQYPLVERLGEARRVTIAHVGERTDDTHGAPEEKAVGDPREAFLPRTAGLVLRASRARA